MAHFDHKDTGGRFSKGFTKGGRTSSENGASGASYPMNGENSGGKNGEKHKKGRRVRFGARGKLPDKKTINLAEIGIEKIDPKAAAAGIILIVIAAAIFSKFLVTDRLYAMYRAGAEESRLRAQLSEAYEELADYGDIESEYAHYTLAGMTKEELSLVDRAGIIRIIENELTEESTATSWMLSGNILTITVNGSDLEEANQLAARLEKYPIVNMCTVTNAVKEDVKTKVTNTADGNAPQEQSRKIVRANIIAYLQTEAAEGED